MLTSIQLTELVVQPTETLSVIPRAPPTRAHAAPRMDGAATLQHTVAKDAFLAAVETRLLLLPQLPRLKVAPPLEQTDVVERISQVRLAMPMAHTEDAAAPTVIVARQKAIARSPMDAKADALMHLRL